jgi:hypothetical protein
MMEQFGFMLVLKSSFISHCWFTYSTPWSGSPVMSVPLMILKLHAMPKALYSASSGYLFLSGSVSIALASYFVRCGRALLLHLPTLASELLRFYLSTLPIEEEPRATASLGL